MGPWTEVGIAFLATGVLQQGRHLKARGWERSFSVWESLVAMAHLSAASHIPPGGAGEMQDARTIFPQQQGCPNPGSLTVTASLTLVLVHLWFHQGGIGVQRGDRVQLCCGCKDLLPCGTGGLQWGWSFLVVGTLAGLQEDSCCRRMAPYCWSLRGRRRKAKDWDTGCVSFLKEAYRCSS